MEDRENDNYTTIKIPSDLAAKIDEFIESSTDGYTSRTDVVKTALRNFFKFERLESGGTNGKKQEAKA